MNALEEDLERQRRRATALDELDRAVQIDVRSLRKLLGCIRPIAGPLEHF